MKNTFSWLILLAIPMLFTACQSDAPGEDFDQTALEIPKEERTRLDYIADVEAFKDTMQARGPLTVTRDGNAAEVTGYFDGDDALMVQVQLPGQEQWHYLQDNMVVLLKEIISQSAGSQFTENQFFYNETSLLGQRTRTAPSLDSLKNSTFKPLSIDTTDMRTKPEEVTGSAISYIHGY